MAREVLIFLIVLAVNTAVALLYLLWNFFRKRKDWCAFLLKALVMLLCPVVGVLYFALSWVLRLFLFKNAVDLIDVIFSKEREMILLDAEEDKEKNLVPLADALNVTDREDARELFLDIIKYDPKKSLHSISLAIDSDDSELSHYATSLIQSELDKARKFVKTSSERILKLEEVLCSVEENDGDIITEEGREFRLRLMTKQDLPERRREEEEEGSKKGYYADLSPALEKSSDYSRHLLQALEQGQLAKYGDILEEKTIFEELTDEMATAHELIAEIDNLLAQHILTEFESRMFVSTLNEISLLVEKRDFLSVRELENNVRINTDIRNYDTAQEWSEKLFRYYPDDVACYAAKIKLLYAKGEREEFLKTIEEMKRSSLTLSKDMIELVRFFG